MAEMMFDKSTPEMEAAVVDAVSKMRVSFVELLRVDGFAGNFVWHMGGNRNIIVWEGLSETAIDTMMKLLNEEKIDISITSLMTYMIDGAFLRYPVVKSVKRNYKKPHWLPLVFNPGTAKR